MFFETIDDAFDPNELEQFIDAIIANCNGEIKYAKLTEEKYSFVLSKSKDI